MTGRTVLSKSCGSHMYCASGHGTKTPGACGCGIESGVEVCTRVWNELWNPPCGATTVLYSTCPKPGSIAIPHLCAHLHPNSIPQPGAPGEMKSAIASGAAPRPRATRASRSPDLQEH
jgi:hypothetical protein